MLHRAGSTRALAGQRILRERSPQQARSRRAERNRALAHVEKYGLGGLLNELAAELRKCRCRACPPGYVSLSRERLATTWCTLGVTQEQQENRA